MFTDTHLPASSSPLHGGVQHKYRFPNGYGASVVCHGYSYGGDEGLWELAVIGPDGHLTYDTPITDDVIGRLPSGAVGRLLDRIADLPQAAQQRTAADV